MGFDLEKRLASELNRLADEATHDHDAQRANKHVERMKRIAAELQARLRNDPELGQDAPGKRNGVENVVASAVRTLEQVGKRRGFEMMPWQQSQRATFDDYRATGLREVLAQLTDRRLRGATLASAEPAIAARSGSAMKAQPSVAGQAMWRVAERRAATLYRHAMDHGEVAGEDPIVDEALERCGSGNPLPLALRKQMEAELGISLSRVRIHNDKVANHAAKAVRAEAFTVGEDIFFAEGFYAPDSREGKKLLAHELTHVVQSYQGRTALGGSGIQVSQPGESLEREADAVADRIDTRAARAVPRSEPRAEAPKARGSSPRIMAPVAAAPAIASPSSSANARLQRRPAAQNGSAQDANGPKARTTDPNKRGQLPNLHISRDRSGERSKRAAKKGADPLRDGGKEISNKVKNVTKGAVSELKSTAKQVSAKGVATKAKSLQQQQKQKAKQQQKQAQKAAKDANAGAKKSAAKAPTKAGGQKNGGGGGGGVGAIKFKAISNWNKYMPAELADQDPKESKRIQGLIKDKVNGERQQSASMLNQLHKAQVAQAKQVRSMLPALKGQINSGKQAAVGKVNAAESAQAGAVTSHVAGVTAQVRATATQMVAQITSAFTAAVNTIRDAKQDATQKLQDAKTQALSDIDTAEADQVTAVNAAFDDTRSAIISLGADKASEASGRGDTYPLSYDGDKLEAARKAAREVAAEYAKAMPQEATKAFDQINQERPKTIADIRKMAVDQRKQVNDAFTQCKETVDQAAEQATTAATEMKTAAVQQIQQTSTTTASQLAAAGRSAVAGIRQQASGARSGIEKAAGAALKSVTDGVNKASSGILKGAMGLAKGCGQVETPNVAETKQRVSEGMQQLGESGRSIAESMKKSASGAVTGFNTQAQGAASGMTQAANAAKQSATQMGAGATQAMSQIGQQSSQGLQQLGDNLKKSTEDIAGKGKEAMKGVVDGLKEAYSAASTQLGDGLRGAVENVGKSFNEAVLPQEDAAIAENSKKAADAVKPWWQKALAFVVSIVVAIVVVVVVTALIVTTGPIGAILVGAAAGALGSVLSQMASNLILGNGLMDGITWQTVAMGAVGGAVGAGFTSAITAGAQRLGMTTVSSALSGTSGVGASAIRTGVGVSGDLVSDAATQIIFTGGYQFSMENLAVSLVTNAATSSGRFNDAQDSFQSSIRNRAGHIEIGRPNGGGLNLSTSAHAPGSPVTNQPAPAGGASGTGGSRDTGGGPTPAGGDRTSAPPAGGDRTAPQNAGAGGDPTPAAPAAGDRTPAAPGADPASTQQTQGADRPPTQGADRPPTQSGDRTPTQGGDRTPTQGGDRTPAQDGPQAQGGDRTQTDGTQADGDRGGNVTRQTDDGGDPTPNRPQGQETRGGDDGANPRGEADGAPRPEGQRPAGDRANPRPDADARPDADGPDRGPDTREQGNDGDSTPDTADDGGNAGPENAAADQLNELGYPNPTRQKADQAAAAIEEGGRPPRDTIRDTEANQRGLRELDAINNDPTLTPESKQNIRREVAERLRAEEPSGDLSRDVTEARRREMARVEAERVRVEAERQRQEQEKAQADADATPTADGTPPVDATPAGPIRPGDRTPSTDRTPVDSEPRRHAPDGGPTQESIESVRATPKPNRPDPAEYLSPEYIAAHRAAFSDGGSRIVLESAHNKYGTYREDGTTFLMTRADADALLARAGGDPTLLEAELGLPAGQLSGGGGLIRIDFPPGGLRIPTGNEAGANDHWIPGGRTPNGNFEAVADRTTAGSETVTPITTGPAPAASPAAGGPSVAGIVDGSGPDGTGPPP